MGVSYDFASSILLCAEDNTSILDFDDDDEEEEEELVIVNGKSRGCGLGKIYDQKNAFLRDSFVFFPLHSEECLLALMDKEVEHLPAKDYAKRLMSGDLDMSVRKDAVEWIHKAHSYYSFGPLSAYLSVNYLDRFLSAYELPQGKAWMTQLLAVACLSLASKMEETEVPISLDLQIGNAKYVFEAKTIQRMELLVLSTLKWRMQSVTPFSFIDYFLHTFNGGSYPNESEIHCSVKIILSTIKGIDLLGFRPSEVAAAVALIAINDGEIVVMEKVLNCCPYLGKEKVIKCYEAIQDMELRGASYLPHPLSSVPQSPIGVLNSKGSRYKSDQTIVFTQATKKRKLNG